jgi:electron transfer flavoprotein beta subunit
VKIAVIIKNIPDTNANIIINSKNDDIEKKNLEFVINPFDEYAVEEAVQYKETHKDIEVIVISFGREYAAKVIRNSLAAGADRAILIENDYSVFPDTLSQALILKKIIIDNNIDLVITGKETGDDQNQLMPPILGALLGWNQAVNVIDAEYSDEGITVTKIVSSSVREKIKLQYPALFSVTKGINSPRYPSIMNIMKAKNKEMHILKPETLTDQITASFEINNLYYPAPKNEGIIIQNEDAESTNEKIKEFLKNII